MSEVMFFSCAFTVSMEWCNSNRTCSSAAAIIGVRHGTSSAQGQLERVEFVLLIQFRIVSANVNERVICQHINSRQN